MNPAKRPIREKNSLKNPLKNPRNPNRAKTQRRVKSTQFTVTNRLSNLPAVRFETPARFETQLHLALVAAAIRYCLFDTPGRRNRTHRTNYPCKSPLVHSLTRLPSLR